MLMKSIHITQRQTAKCGCCNRDASYVAMEGMDLPPSLLTLEGTQEMAQYSDS